MNFHIVLEIFWGNNATDLPIMGDRFMNRFMVCLRTYKRYPEDEIFFFGEKFSYGPYPLLMMNE